MLDLDIELHAFRHHEDNFLSQVATFLIDLLDLLCKFDFKELGVLGQGRLQEYDQQWNHKGGGHDQRWKVEATFS